MLDEGVTAENAPELTIAARLSSARSSSPYVAICRRVRLETASAIDGIQGQVACTSTCLRIHPSHASAGDFGANWKRRNSSCVTLVYLDFNLASMDSHLDIGSNLSSSKDGPHQRHR